MLIVLTIGPRKFSPIVKRLLDDGDILDGHGHRSSGSGINALTHQERLTGVEHIAVGGEGSQTLGDIKLGQNDLGIQTPPVTIEYSIFIKSSRLVKLIVHHIAVEIAGFGRDAG